MTDSAPERWLPVTGWEGWYEVSDLGRVRSLDRDVLLQMPYGPAVRHYRGKILAPFTRASGYPWVRLSRPGCCINRLVHRLVLAAYAGPCPPGQEARHGPGGKPDASLSNLRWSTRAQNVGADRLRDGQDNRGERHGQAVLTERKVLEIRRRREAGERNIDLAREFRVSDAVIWAVVHRTSWAWLT